MKRKLVSNDVCSFKSSRCGVIQLKKCTCPRTIIIPYIIPSFDSLFVAFELTFLTSDKQNAGTTENAWIVLEGEERKYQEYSVENSAKNKVLHTSASFCLWRQWKMRQEVNVWLSCSACCDCTVRFLIDRLCCSFDNCTCPCLAL